MKDKIYRKVRDHSHCKGEYRGAAHSISNLKYSFPKKIPIAFSDACNYDYHFIIKEIAEKFKKQFTCLGENTETYITFIVPIEKKIQELIKIEKKLPKIYLKYYNLLIVQDLWQVHYQILSRIFLKKIIKLNVSTGTMIKNVKIAELNIDIATFFFNI